MFDVETSLDSYTAPKLTFVRVLQLFARVLKMKISVTFVLQAICHVLIAAFGSAGTDR